MAYIIDNGELIEVPDESVVQTTLEESRAGQIDNTWRVYQNLADKNTRNFTVGVNTPKYELKHKENNISNYQDILIDGGVLTSEQLSEKEAYTLFTDNENQNHAVAIDGEAQIKALTTIEEIQAFDVYALDWIASPFSPLNYDQREMLIGELVSQSTIIFDDYDAVDQTGMAEFINSGTKYTITGSYTGMPGGREVYEAIGEDQAASIDSGWVITQHMTQDTYFDNSIGEFRLISDDEIYVN